MLSRDDIPDRRPDDPDDPNRWDEAAGRRIPRFIGDCRVFRFIAEGGMGEVYEAEQPGLKRLVALKVVRADRLSAHAASRFIEEAQITANLRHPNIAAVLAVGSDSSHAPPRPYILMELVRGRAHAERPRDLLTYVQQQRLDVRQRVALLARVCPAIAHAHSRGIVHRDLKPSNIPIDESVAIADDPLLRCTHEPRIVDFGIARALFPVLDPELAAGGELAGSWPFMSPEQTTADPARVDARSDIYALGVILYLLITDQLPIDLSGCAWPAAAERIRTNRPAPPSSLVPGLDPGLDWITLKSLQKDPAQRYSSVDQFHEDLRKWLDGRSVGPEAPSAPPTFAGGMTRAVRESTRRHPIAAALWIAALAALFAQFPAAMLFDRLRLNAPFQRLAANAAPAAAGSLGHVRIILLDNDTDYAALASSLSLPPADPDSLVTLRPLHARLMLKLKSSGARVFVSDIALRDKSQTEADTAIADAATQLAAAGVPFVVGVPAWPLDRGVEPELSPIIRPHASWGGVSIHDQVTWNVDLLAQRGSEPPQPSLTAAAAAAYWHPGAHPTYSFGDQSQPPAILFDTAPRIDLPDCPITACEGQTDDLAAGLHPGDSVRELILRAPRDESLRAACISYGRVMSAGETELRALFSDRAALLIDARTGAPDLARHPDGRTVPAGFVHAAAIESLLAGNTLREPGTLVSWSLAMAAGLLSSILVFHARTRARRVAFILTLALIWLVASIILLAYASLLISPLVPAAAIAAASGLAWFVRNPAPEFGPQSMFRTSRAFPRSTVETR